MKYIAVAMALGMTAPALASQDEPVLMTEAQLDEVVAGQPTTDCDSTLLCVAIQGIDVGVVANVGANALNNVNANVLGQQGNVDQVNNPRNVQFARLDQAP